MKPKALSINYVTAKKSRTPSPLRDHFQIPRPLPHSDPRDYFLPGWGGELGGNFYWGKTSEIFTAEFSHFLMTILLDFLRPPPPKNSPNFSAWRAQIIGVWGTPPQLPRTGGRGCQNSGKGFSLGGHVKFLVKTLVTFL